jgi:replicative superfamily II helicase
MAWIMHLAHHANATKHLHEETDEEKEKEKKKEKKKGEGKREEERKNEEEIEETSILSDFCACMFEYEDIAEFKLKFDLMRKKVSKQTWLDSDMGMPFGYPRISIPGPAY